MATQVTKVIQALVTQDSRVKQVLRAIRGVKVIQALQHPSVYQVQAAFLSVMDPNVDGGLIISGSSIESGLSALEARVSALES